VSCYCQTLTIHWGGVSVPLELLHVGGLKLRQDVRLAVSLEDATF